MKEVSLFDLPPSEEEMYQAAISEPLDAKVRKAVGLLQMMCAGKRAVVCFSGGKDSVVIKHLAIIAGIDVDPVYSMTTIDPPELIYYIRDHHKDVVWRKPEMHMLRYMVEAGKGLPTRIFRWCCEKYKENTGNECHLKIIGVRAEESVRRKGMWKQVNASRKNKGVMILAPIVYWTDRDVWNFIHGENLAYCRLYDDGFKRLGCIGCPLAGPAAQANEFDRWPRYKNLWWLYTQKFWERWHGMPNSFGKPRWFEAYGSAVGYFDWWLSGKARDSQDNTMIQQALELNDKIPDDVDCQSRFATM